MRPRGRGLWAEAWAIPASVPPVRRPARLGLWLLAVITALGQAQREPSGYQFVEVLHVTPIPAPSGPVGFTEMPVARTGIDFTNHLSPHQIVENNNYMNGSGVAAGDIDGDGRCDLYFCSIVGTNVLYRNLGDWRFERLAVSDELGLAGRHSTGAVFVDFDGDGDRDLLVATLGSGVHAFENDSRGRFREVTAQAGLAAETGSTTLTLADVDGDADLDLYVANYGAIPIMRSGGRVEIRRVNGNLVVTGPLAQRIRIVEGRLEEQGEPDVLYLNDGRGRFQPIPWNTDRFVDETGQPVPELLDFGLTAQFRDATGDGVPDLYVCNDFQTSDRFWVNDGSGRFRALPRSALRKEAYSAMGVDFADLDRDGHLDFLVTEMLSRDHTMRMRQIMPGPTPSAVPSRPEVRAAVTRNVLQHNQGDGTYCEMAHFSGVTATDWSWQPVFLDVDFDGFEDLLVINGMPLNILHRDTLDRLRTLGRQPIERLRTNVLSFPPFPTRNVAFRNDGALRFSEMSAAWGFASARITQSILLADLDNDGDQDFVANSLNDDAVLGRNDSVSPRMAVRLRGRPPNTAGIGAFLRVRSGSFPEQTQEIVSGGRYLAGDDASRSFAVAPAPARTSLEIRWRTGRRSLIADIPPNHLCVVDEPADPSPPRESGIDSPPRPPLFQEWTLPASTNEVEAPFNDLGRQPLLPRQLHRAGPAVAWFDFDQDGVDELVAGAGRGGTLRLYRYGHSGAFERSTLLPPWTAPDDLMGFAAWATSTGKPGLLAALAQYEAPDPRRASVLKLGSDFADGRWMLSEVAATRAVADSAGPLAVADFDADGDLDVFVGGRVIPGAYPDAADSYLYRQDGADLVRDARHSALLAKVGLVNGAVWSDLNADGFPELVLACEWGPLRIYRNDRGELSPWVLPDFEKWTGWWHGVNSGDFDEDGRLDLVASNWGLNDAYQASPAQPLALYYGVRGNDRLAQLVEATFVPELQAEAPRRDLETLRLLFPALANRFPTHDAFATATLAELQAVIGPFPRKLTANTLASCLFLNRGDRFLAVPLPREAQISPAFAVNVADVDGDGHEDVFLSQNFSATRPGWSRVDEGRGLWLLGDGTGNFRAMSARESGLDIRGDQRGAALSDFDHDGRIDMAIGLNDAPLRLFRNQGALPGLRVRLKGLLANPWGIGTRLRVQSQQRWGPARELHAGSGYGSQDGLVPVLSHTGVPDRLEITWPGGASHQYPVPVGSRELELDIAGALRVLK